MPRVALAVQEVRRNDSGSISWTAADTASGHYFVNDGQTQLLALCLDASTKDVTIVGVLDPNNRIQDEVMTVAITTGLSVSGVLPPSGWSQTGAGDRGRVHVDTSADTSLFLAAVRFKD